MVKMIVMDVDGTLTDGKIYMGENGEVMKAFNCHDAVGVRKLKDKIISVIITGRKSKITLNRAHEMDVTLVYQNVSDKKSKLLEICEEKSISLDDILYIGDDINDLDCLKVCGVSCCPKDAAKEVKNECDFISNFNAGEGAVREIIDLVLLGNFD
ncbi:MAG: HAD hydrolase family protein [Bacilli bacterium]|nr:HAD hydrolase family protein [Bacilli bacterium]